MNKEEKIHSVRSFSKDLKASQMALIFDFKGLKVKEATSLRKNFMKNKARMKIIKNTLARRALEEEPEMKSHLSSDLKGTNAFVLVQDKAHLALKAFSDFKRENEQPLKVKKAYLRNYGVLGDVQIKKWARLPAKEVLQAKLLSLMQTQGSRFLSTLQAVSIKFLDLLTSYKNVKSENKK